MKNTYPVRLYPHDADGPRTNIVSYLVEMYPAVGSVPQQIHHVLHSRTRSISSILSMQDVENECYKTWTGN